MLRRVGEEKAIRITSIKIPPWLGMTASILAGLSYTRDGCETLKVKRNVCQDRGGRGKAGWRVSKRRGILYPTKEGSTLQS